MIRVQWKLYKVYDDKFCGLHFRKLLFNTLFSIYKNKNRVFVVLCVPLGFSSTLNFTERTHVPVCSGLRWKRVNSQHCGGVSWTVAKGPRHSCKGPANIYRTLGCNGLIFFPTILPHFHVYIGWGANWKILRRAEINLSSCVALANS